MSGRYGPSLIAGKGVYGVTGLGIAASVIRATTADGDHGPGLLYNEWDSSADDAKKLRLLVVTPPSAGAFFAYEDGSFTLTGAPDGSYSLTYRVFVDGVDQGTAVASFQVGNVALRASATATGTASARLTTRIALKASATASGLASAQLRTGIRLRASATASGVASARLADGLTSLRASASASGLASARLTTSIRLRASAYASGVASARLAGHSAQIVVPPQRQLYAVPEGASDFAALDF